MVNSGIIKLFHILFLQTFLSYILMWFVCFLLTIGNVLPSDPHQRGYQARTDAKIANVHNMEWFFMPYPGKYIDIAEF